MRKGSSESAKELTRIFAKDGLNNEEFYTHVIKFFWYLQKRYIGKRVPEMDNDFWAALVKSMEYYDPERLNIVSWVHTIGRGVCSSYNYHWKKRTNESPEPLAHISENEATQTLDHSILDSDCLKEVFQGSIFKATDYAALGKQIVTLHDTNPLAKHVLWELSKSR